MTTSTIQPPPDSNASPFMDFVCKWTPRLLVAGFCGYYALGMAYDFGLMALIDRVAIAIFKHFFGYAGIGAFMPTFQWYSAWAVRIVVAALAGLLYDLMERIVCFCIKKIRGPDATTSTPA